MGDQELVIQAESLSKRYGSVLALDGLSLDVRAGEVLGFLGPNGAGKTTTVRLLMGYLRPSAGSARVHGLDCWRDSVAVYARTGYLPFGQRFAALAAGITTVMITACAALWVFSAMLNMGLGLGAIASATAALGIFGLFAGTVALALGAATGSPAAARGLAALAAVASYLINALAQVTTALRPARPLSPYYLVLGNEPLAHGLRLTGAVAVLAAVAAIAAAGGILFARRDLN